MCLAVPISFPSLPAPFTLGVTVLPPPVSFNSKACCNFPILNITPPPIGLVLPTGALFAAITAALGTITTSYVDLLPLKCALE